MARHKSRQLLQHLRFRNDVQADYAYSFMAEHVDDGNAFAIPELWGKSSLANFEQDTSSSLALGFEPLSMSSSDLHGTANDWCYIADLFHSHDDVFGISKSLELQLTDLYTHGPLEDLGALDTSSVSSSPESFEVPEVLENDIWSFPDTDQSGRINTALNSWEKFYDRNFQEFRTVYISEGGPQVFDAALAVAAGTTEDDDLSSGPGRVVQSGPLLSCLFQLGLGRESILYSYNQNLQSFQPRLTDGRMTGYSLEAFQSLSDSFIDYGNKTKELRSFIDKTQASSGSFPALMALAGSFSSLLNTLHVEIGEALKSVHTLLELQLLFGRPGQILTLLSDLGHKLGRTETDEELLSKLYGIVLDSEHSAIWIRLILFRILIFASKPWLESAGGWLGLKALSVPGTRGQCPKFVSVTEEARKAEHWKDIKQSEYHLEPQAIPSFLAKEDARILFETGRSLRLLEAHQPEHPLLKAASFGLKGIPKLEWCSSWVDVENIQTKAQKYESELLKAISDFDSHSGSKSLGHKDLEDPGQYQFEVAGLSEDTARAYISASIAALEKPLPRWDTKVDNGPLFASTQDKSILFDTLDEEVFSPPTSLLPVLSFNPLISIQAQLINRACLRLLFKEHNLRSHFSLLHRYSLFGDGVFASRLSHALFDPELPTAERRQGRSRAGISGLKLGSRDTWPPASSELRLALMGILTESYHDTRQLEGSSLFNNELPGGLSFAIRDMSEEELKRCMDPNSIEALDFLRLQYNPPPPLSALITQDSLLKYDAVFKLLLRTVRMLFVVNQLFHDTKDCVVRSDYLFQRFRIESHHFTLAISGYFFDGVQANWSILESKLKDTERALDRDGLESLANLRHFHEQILDRMMFTLILRKRQAQVMKLLEEIFSLILQFARHIRSKACEKSEVADSISDIRQIYEKFKKKVRVLISVCRGLSERRGQGGTTAHEAFQDVSRSDETSEDGGNTMGQLLLKFEMSGFYGR